MPGPELQKAQDIEYPYGFMFRTECVNLMLDTYIEENLQHPIKCLLYNKTTWERHVYDFCGFS